MIAATPILDPQTTSTPTNGRQQPPVPTPASRQTPANTDPSGQQGNSPARRVTATNTPDLGLAALHKQVEELENEQLAKADMSLIRQCLKNPALAKEKGIIITVQLAGSDQVVKVAPPEEGWSEARLKEYVDAAGNCLNQLTQRFSTQSADYYTERLKQYKNQFASVSASLNNNTSWEQFLAAIKNADRRRYNCQTDDFTVTLEWNKTKASSSQPNSQHNPQPPAQEDEPESEE